MLNAFEDLRIAVLCSRRAPGLAHREWMIRNSWGPLLVRTIENFACGLLEAEALVSSQ